jgi:hypothetical protein
MRAIARFWIAASVALLVFADPTCAQQSSYVPGTVWVLTSIKTEPGQSENYLDWLGSTWKRLQEMAKKEGYVVSYHVLQQTNARENEPDLILAVEYKDFLTNAQRVAYQKKMEALLSEDPHKSDAKAGERKTLRKLAGDMELQELNLK